MEMQRNEILQGLVELANAIERTSEQKQFICIAGSSALMLTCGLSDDRLTRDIDIIRCSDGVLKAMQTLYEYDFNNAVHTFDNDANFMQTQELECGFPMLNIETLTPESVVIMKLMADRDNDRADIADAIEHGINCQKVTDLINNFDFAISVGTDVATNAKNIWNTMCPEKYATPLVDFFDTIDTCEQERDLYGLDEPEY